MLCTCTLYEAREDGVQNSPLRQDLEYSMTRADETELCVGGGGGQGKT
jgi:hypothetical protein